MIVNNCPRKILAIEDDPSLLKLYKEMFVAEEVDLIGVTTGQEGLDLARSEKPDLILLDIMLPGGINGFDVLEQLQRNPLTKPIPVVVLTNIDSEGKIAQSIGARDYIIKVDTTKDKIVKSVMSLIEP